MKNEVKELIEKYERKAAYRETRLASEEKKLEVLNEKYENNECSFERLFNQQKNVAIEYDLLNQLKEFIEDLKNL